MKLAIQIITYLLLLILINESCIKVSTNTSTGRHKKLCIHVLHPKGDIIPCSHIMHPGGDPSNVTIMFSPRDIYPTKSNNTHLIQNRIACTHKLHTEHIQPCSHFLHPRGD